MPDPVDQLEAGHIGKAKVDDHTIDMTTLQGGKRFLPSPSGYSVYVAVADQLYHCCPLTFVIFDHQDSSGAFLNKALKIFKRFHQGITIDRLFKIPNRTELQREVALVKRGNDL